MVFFRKANASRRSRRRGGFSLVEVLLALAVLGIAMLSILGLLNATFESVSRNVMTRQALSVYSCVDNAFSSVSTFIKSDGNTFISESQMTKPSFDYVYDWVRAKTGKNWNDALFLVCISRRLNANDEGSPQRVLQVMKCDSASDVPTQDELNDLDAEGQTYFLRVYLSPQLRGRYVQMDESGEVASTQYAVGDSLPSNVDTYALPYVPLTVDIYPFSNGATQNENLTPILTQYLVIMR